MGLLLVRSGPNGLDMRRVSPGSRQRMGTRVRRGLDAEEIIWGRPGPPPRRQGDGDTFRPTPAFQMSVRVPGPRLAREVCKEDWAEGWRQEFPPFCEQRQAGQDLNLGPATWALAGEAVPGVTGSSGL